MPNVPMNPNGFPNGQPPDPTPMFQQRLENSLNPSIGVPQKDTDPQAMAAFMVKSNPDQAAGMLAKVLMMLRARQQPIAQPQPSQPMRQPPPEGGMPPNSPLTPQAMQQFQGGD